MRKHGIWKNRFIEFSNPKKEASVLFNISDWRKFNVPGKWSGKFSLEPPKDFEMWNKMRRVRSGGCHLSTSSHCCTSRQLSNTFRHFCQRKIIAYVPTCGLNISERKAGYGFSIIQSFFKCQARNLLFSHSICVRLFYKHSSMEKRKW